ncbi:hypothetical protein BpHYR1_017095 [Brachionus plicatilis]|uniref:Uncharacterized protein n=1 Tax=Brachionus plicatilis TaxID=10195 RepID=A0A3M7RH07_BRAPC|nr:hypothetical protein BpHYR1_017095 [Brachionus plicatilis]
MIEDYVEHRIHNFSFYKKYNSLLNNYSINKIRSFLRQKYKKRKFELGELANICHFFVNTVELFENISSI